MPRSHRRTPARRPSTRVTSRWSIIALTIFYLFPPLCPRRQPTARSTSVRGGPPGATDCYRVTGQDGRLVFSRVRGRPSGKRERRLPAVFRGRFPVAGWSAHRPRNAAAAATSDHTAGCERTRLVRNFTGFIVFQKYVERTSCCYYESARVVRRI